MRIVKCERCGTDRWEGDGPCATCGKVPNELRQPYGREPYACSSCGYHPDSLAGWCAAGCGSDYNVMTRIVLDECWSEILRGEDVPPQATLELNDYAMLLREVPKVYDHVTGGRISKPNTIASAVIAEADELIQRCADEAVEEKMASVRELFATHPDWRDKLIDQAIAQYLADRGEGDEPEFEGEVRRWGLAR